MVLVRAWVKDELEGILQVGATSPPATYRRPRKKQHVQCVEVDEKHNALKINDGETMVWCFVTKTAMHNNPSFASLNNKTITIDDWEFSSISELCPAFDEKKAKNNGYICILINKFCLFGGERTTTIGKPSDLGEGNRDLRAIWRSLSTPRDLVRALVRGQGLTDLRDMDGVVMAAPESELEGVTWEDVEPTVMMVLTPPPSPLGERNPQPNANAGTPPRGDHSPPAGGSTRGGNSTEKRGGGGGGAERDPSLDDMTQQSLGMDYDGGFGGGDEDFQTQAPSAGNVFSQEEMDMRPASPTPPSPPSPGMASGGGGGGGGGSDAGGAAGAGVAAAPAQEQNDGVAQDPMPGFPGAVPNAHGEHAPLGQGGRVSQGRGPQPACGGAGANGKGPGARGRGGGRRQAGGNDREEEVEEEEEGEEEEESGTDPIPPGFTQLDVLAGDGALGLSAEPQRTEADSENDEPEEDKDDDEEEQIGGTRRGNGAAAGSGRAGRTVVSAVNKGKGRVSFERPSPPDDEQEAGRIRAATAGGSGGSSSGGGGGGATQDSLSPEDILTPHELSGATSSSSNIGTPNSNQLVLSCLTQKRQNEGLYHANSGARNAAQKCDIRSVFHAGGGPGPGAAAAPASRRKHGGSNDRDGLPRNGIRGNSGGGGSGGCYGAEGGGDFSSSTPDTVEMQVEDGLKSSVMDRVARRFPTRPLRGGSVTGGRKRSRPLSDILVAVDPAWDGEGRPPIIARGADADKNLAEWLDSSRPETRPAPLSVGAWLDKYAGGGWEDGGGSSGGADRVGGGSRSGGGGGGGESGGGRGGSDARGGWRF